MSGPRRTRAVRRARPGNRSDLALAAELRRTFEGPLPTIPSRCFYDDRGSALFDEITRLPEYYQTRTEEAILRICVDEIAARMRARELVELGSGMSPKLHLLVDALRKTGSLEVCVLFDINESVLAKSVEKLTLLYPGLTMEGLAGDFLADLGSLGAGGGRLIAFLGSTIGNLHPQETPGFLRAIAAALEPGDAFLVGLDLVKDRHRLEAAYNDSQGVTAAFNLNILKVINDSLGADFDPDAFEHVAFYDSRQAWIEMRLQAARPTRVRIPSAGIDRRFQRGDEIRTEISCKYSRESWDALSEGTGLEREAWYTDDEGLFALALNRRQGPIASSAG